MECRDFESVIADLARERLMESAKRDSAAAHLQECRACASRLEDERALAAGLRALAASYSEQEAPRRVEDALLAAFRNRATIAPAVSLHRVKWMRVAMAAAAAIIIIAALIWSRQSGETPPQQVPQHAQPQKNEPQQNERERKLDAIVPHVGQDKRKDEGAPQPKRRLKPRGLRVAKDSDAKAGRAASLENEIATDFFPLVDYENLVNFEGGEIRRVTLSRPALASLGLPVNMDRANEPVKADVLVGHDGLARAIRFVR